MTPSPPIARLPAQGPQTPPKRRERRGFAAFVRAHKVAAALVVLALIGATVGVATLIIRQDFVATPATHAAPISFAAGDDVATLVTLGYVASPSFPNSGTSASMTIYGVPGATSVSLGEILKLQSNSAAGGQAYDVTLSSTALPAGVTSLVLSFTDSGTGGGARTWIVGASTPTYTLSAEEVWEMSAVIVMPASGSLSAFTISADITPVP